MTPKKPHPGQVSTTHLQAERRVQQRGVSSPRTPASTSQNSNSKITPENFMPMTGDYETTDSEFTTSLSDHLTAVNNLPPHTRPNASSSPAYIYIRQELLQPTLYGMFNTRINDSQGLIQPVAGLYNTGAPHDLMQHLDSPPTPENHPIEEALRDIRREHQILEFQTTRIANDQSPDPWHAEAHSSRTAPLLQQPSSSPPTTSTAHALKKAQCQSIYKPGSHAALATLRTEKLAQLAHHTALLVPLVERMRELNEARRWALTEPAENGERFCASPTLPPKILPRYIAHTAARIATPAMPPPSEAMECFCEEVFTPELFNQRSIVPGAMQLLNQRVNALREGRADEFAPGEVEVACMVMVAVMLAAKVLDDEHDWYFEDINKTWYAVVRGGLSEAWGKDEADKFDLRAFNKLERDWVAEADWNLRIRPDHLSEWVSQWEAWVDGEKRGLWNEASNVLKRIEDEAAEFKIDGVDALSDCKACVRLARDRHSRLGQKVHSMLMGSMIPEDMDLLYRMWAAV